MKTRLNWGYFARTQWPLWRPRKNTRPLKVSFEINGRAILLLKEADPEQYRETARQAIVEAFDWALKYFDKEVR